VRLSLIVAPPENQEQEKSMRKKILQHRVIVTNALICAVVGVAFGSLSGRFTEWVLGGLVLSMVLGALADGVFLGFVKNQKIAQHRLLIVVALAALLAIYVVIPGYGAYNVVHPFRYATAVTPMDLGIEHEDIEFVTSDSVKLVDIGGLFAHPDEYTLKMTAFFEEQLLSR
jgi:hypothetical protein